MEDYYRYKKYKLKYLALKYNLVGGFTSKTIDFNSDFYGAIIGIRGATIQEIQRRSGTRINVGQPKSDKITIRYDSNKDFLTAVKLIRQIEEREKARFSHMEPDYRRSSSSYSKGDGAGRSRNSRGDGAGRSSYSKGRSVSIPYPETLNYSQKGELISFFREIRGCTCRLFHWGEGRVGSIVISGKCNLDYAKKKIEEKIQEIRDRPVIRVERIYPSDHPIITSSFRVNDEFLSVWSWNCNLQGTQNMSRRILDRFIVAVQKTIMSIITNESPDIILLQEYNVRGKTDEYLQMFNENNYFFLTSKLWGVCTLVKKNIQLVKRSETPLENNLPLIMNDANITTSYRDSSPLLKSCSPIDISEEEYHIRGEEYLHHPPMIYYKQGDRYKVGKNTSLDIVVKIGGINIRVRNIHLAVKDETDWNLLYPNFLEVLSGELLLLGGDFNAKNERTGTRGLNSISSEWEPVMIDSSSLDGFSSLGIWNDGFVFSNRLVWTDSNYYLRDFNYRKQEDKIEGVDENTLISNNYNV